MRKLRRSVKIISILDKFIRSLSGHVVIMPPFAFTENLCLQNQFWSVRPKFLIETQQPSTKAMAGATNSAYFMGTASAAVGLLALFATEQAADVLSVPFGAASTSSSSLLSRGYDGAEGRQEDSTNNIENALH
jgi:hypothetical protein